MDGHLFDCHERKNERGRKDGRMEERKLLRIYKLDCNPTGTPLYGLYIYIAKCSLEGYKLWFLSSFGLKMGLDFDNLGVTIGNPGSLCVTRDII